MNIPTPESSSTPLAADGGIAMDRAPSENRPEGGTRVTITLPFAPLPRA